MEGHSWRGSATGLRLPCVGIGSVDGLKCQSLESCARIFALNRLVPVPLSCCAQTIRGRGGLVPFSWVDSCMKHTTYHGIISNYNKSSIV